MELERIKKHFDTEFIKIKNVRTYDTGLFGFIFAFVDFKDLRNGSDECITLRLLKKYVSLKITDSEVVANIEKCFEEYFSNDHVLDMIGRAKDFGDEFFIFGSKTKLFKLWKTVQALHLEQYRQSKSQEITV